MTIYYKYLFYFLYNFFKRKKGKNAIPLTTRAHGLLALLDVIFIGGLLFDYTVIFGFTFEITPNYVYIFAIILLVYHFWLFILNNRQMRYVEEFSAWPITKQNKWNRIMRVIIFLVISNFLISLFLMQQRYGK